MRHTDDDVRLFKSFLIGFEGRLVRKDFALVEALSFQNVDRLWKYAFTAIENRRRTHVDFSSQFLVVVNHSAEHKLAIRASADV